MLGVDSSRQNIRRCYDDFETFRLPPLIRKRTIRIRDEGRWSGVGGTYGSAALQPCSSGAELRKLNTD